MYILGINEAHDSSASLLKNEEIIAACQEERFTRIKNQGGFPKQAISYCLEQENISLKNIDLLVFGSSNPLRNTTYAVDANISNFLATIFHISPSIFILYRIFLHFI